MRDIIQYNTQCPFNGARPDSMMPEPELAGEIDQGYAERINDAVERWQSGRSLTFSGDRNGRK